MVNGDGLVGKVVRVAPFTAQVLLAIDPEFTVVGRLAAHGTAARCTGNGLTPARDGAARPTAKVSKGEAIVTQGVRATSSRASRSAWWRA